MSSAGGVSLGVSGAVAPVAAVVVFSVVSEEDGAGDDEELIPESSRSSFSCASVTQVSFMQSLSLARNVFANMSLIPLPASANHVPTFA